MSLEEGYIIRWWTKEFVEDASVGLRRRCQGNYTIPLGRDVCQRECNRLDEKYPELEHIPFWVPNKAAAQALAESDGG